MNWLKFLAVFAFIVLICNACGEDRTYEYNAKTERNHWMMDVMKRNYLWADSIVEDKVDWQKYFTKPNSFLAELTKFAPVTDSWSWCSIDTLNEDYHNRGFFNHVESYGLDFVVMTDPTRATSRQYARVMSILPDSPADRCGLERGDFILSVDGNKFTSSMTDKLVSGKQRSLTVADVDISDDGTEFVWTEEKNLIMDKSEWVEDIPYPVVKSFLVDDNKLGYLMCNSLSEHPLGNDSHSDSYNDELNNCMAILKTQSPNILIVDFRLCNWGTIEMADKFASFLLNYSFAGDVFAHTIYNKHRESDNNIYLFDDFALNNALGVSDVFFITSEYTAGAAEWVIRAARATLGDEHVFVVGMTTKGQIVMTEDIASDYYVTLHPAVALVADKNGEYDYLGGIKPDLQIDERSVVKLYPYGDSEEVLLKSVLDEIEAMF